MNKQSVNSASLLRIFKANARRDEYWRVVWASKSFGNDWTWPLRIEFANKQYASKIVFSLRGHLNSDRRSRMDQLRLRRNVTHSTYGECVPFEFRINAPAGLLNMDYGINDDSLSRITSCLSADVFPNPQTRLSIHCLTSGSKSLGFMEEGMSVWPTFEPVEKLSQE
jgi:hypothetical protein